MLRTRQPPCWPGMRAKVGRRPVRYSVDGIIAAGNCWSQAQVRGWGNLGKAAPRRSQVQKHDVAAVLVIQLALDLDFLGDHEPCGPARQAILQFRLKLRFLAGDGSARGVDL